MSIKTTTTSINQLAASAKYYNKNKKEINEKRKEYFKEYALQRAKDTREDEEKRLARNEYQRPYQRTRKALMITKLRLPKMMPEECLELQALEIYTT